ncbi:MAG TPA: FAD-binding oxidoreductase, partial [Solirubrobacteraceae bacterium]
MSTRTFDFATNLAERLRGHVIGPDHPEYDAARRVWNGMIDKRPLAIARCADADDVAATIRFAIQHDLPLAVRGGGHNVAGTAVVDDGVVIDLSSMREVRIDASGSTVHVQGGATWADVDAVTTPLGLATPGGVVSDTGVAGLALSGGVSHQRRRDGMTIDNLVSAEVVLADGRVVRASADEHADLHWALRGGGGNFGVVTSFEYRLHPVGPTIVGGMVAHRLADAKDVLRFYREFSRTAPDELTTYAGFVTPPEGETVVALACCYSGPLDKGEEAVRPLRRFGSPMQDALGPMPYGAMQQLFDAGFGTGASYYVKGTFLPEMTDGAIEVFSQYAATKPSPLTGVLVQTVRGAASRVAP